jgi:hypothetical protein
VLVVSDCSGGTQHSMTTGFSSQRIVRGRQWHETLFGMRNQNFRERAASILVCDTQQASHASTQDGTMTHRQLAQSDTSRTAHGLQLPSNVCCSSDRSSAVSGLSSLTHNSSTPAWLASRSRTTLFPFPFSLWLQQQHTACLRRQKTATCPQPPTSA